MLEAREGGALEAREGGALGAREGGALGAREGGRWGRGRGGGARGAGGGGDDVGGKGGGASECVRLCYTRVEGFGVWAVVLHTCRGFWSVRLQAGPWSVWVQAGWLLWVSSRVARWMC